MSVKKDQLIGLAACIFGGGVIYTSMQFPESTLTGDIGPSVFPILAGIIVLLCGIILLVPKKNAAAAKHFLTKEQEKRLAGMFGVYILLWLGMKDVGYLIAVPVIVYTICTLMARGQKTKVWQRLLYTIIVSAAVYVLFQVILGIRLPEGILF